jgi:hypothetical protein
MWQFDGWETFRFKQEKENIMDRVGLFYLAANHFLQDKLLPLVFIDRIVYLYYSHPLTDQWQYYFTEATEPMVPNA